MKRFGFVLFALFMVPAAVRAAEPAIAISEVGWAGSSASTADEWLELYNPGDGDVDLSGWTIEGAATGGAALILPAGSVISASGTFLIANYKEDDSRSTLAAVPDWVTTAVALSNSSFHMVLRDAASNTVDVAGALEAPPFAGNSGDRKASMERLYPFAAGDQPSSWATSATSTGFDAGAAESGTPGFFAETAAVPISVAGETAETVVDPEPVHVGPESSSSAVRIYELYPSPAAGESEWLELYNPSSVGEWLEGWTLTEGSEAATRLEGMLLPWSRLVVRSPKGSLNNDGDVIVLKDARGRVVDGVAYGAWETAMYPSAGGPKRGESVMRIELQNEWAVTTTPTPGTANVLTLADAPKTASEARNETASVTPATPNPVATNSVPVVIPTRSDPSAAPDMTNTKNPPEKKTPTVKKSRFKGRAYEATVAVPPGVYGKTRLYVLTEGRLAELRLNVATKLALSAGTGVRFIAQEKSEDEEPYLAANANSLSADGTAEPEFPTVDEWPDRDGAYVVRGIVNAVEGRNVILRANRRDGVIRLPAAASNAGLTAGDEISVRGYVSAGEQPRMVLSSADGLALIKGYRRETDRQEPPRLPWPATAMLTSAAAGVGLLAYLRHERLKRLALTERSVQEEFIEAE